MDNLFLGSGCKFPPQINPTTGRFMTVEGSQSVKESIFIILQTHRGERFLRPQFGSNIQNFVFAQADATLLNLMTYEIEQDIETEEPRVQNVEVTIDNSTPGAMYVNVAYEIRGENTAENLVFPFYLGEKPVGESDNYETMEDYYTE